MSIYPFLENLIAVLLVAPLGAGVMALMSSLVYGLRYAFGAWCYLTLGFIVLGTLAALPTLLTGERYSQNDRPCPGAAYGYSCY